MARDGDRGPGPVLQPVRPGRRARLRQAFRLPDLLRYTTVSVVATGLQQLHLPLRAELFGDEDRGARDPSGVEPQGDGLGSGTRGRVVRVVPAYGTPVARELPPAPSRPSTAAPCGHLPPWGSAGSAEPV